MSRRPGTGTGKSVGFIQGRAKPRPGPDVPPLDPVANQIVSRYGGSTWQDQWYIPYNPDKLYIKGGSSYRLLDEIREDDQVGAVLKVKKHMMLGRGWQIEAGAGGETFAEALDFARWALGEGLKRGFDETLFQMLTAFEFGFSLTEKIHAPAPEGPWKGMPCYAEFRTRPPHNFYIDQDKQGTVTGLRQDDLELPLQKFVHYIHNQEFGNPFGKPDIDRGIYRAWWAKNEIIKFWNIFLERFGMPVAVGHYGPAATAADRARLLTLLDRLQAKTAMVVPEGTRIEFLEAAKDAGGFQAAVESYNLMIARGMLVPDLLGFSGGKTEGGSYSLGEKHFEMFYTILGRERKYLEGVVNAQILSPLVEMNYGPEAAAAVRFALKPLTEDDVSKTMESWSKMVQAAGIKPGEEEVNFARKLLGFPEGKAEMAPPRPSPFNPPSREPGKPGLEDENQEYGGNGGKKFAEKEDPSSAPYRDLTGAEKRVDFAEIRRRTGAIEGSAVAALAPIVQRAVDGLADQAAKKDVIGKQDLGFALDPPLEGEREFRKALLASLQAARDFGGDQAAAELKKTGKFTEVPGLGAEGLKDLLDSIAEYVAHTEWETIRKLTTPILQNAIQNGVSLRQAMKEIDQALQGYDISLGAGRLETIVRTNVNDAFNEGRRLTFQAAQDQIEGFQFSAIMDGRTSEVCGELDGKIFKPDEIGKWNPPLHYNCRSVLVAVLKGEPADFSPMPAVTSSGGGFLELA